MEMGFFEKLVHNILSLWRDKNKRKKLNRLVLTAGIILVFMTTYVMILPAITVEKDKAKDMPGVYLETDSSHDEEQRTRGEDSSDKKTEDRDDSSGSEDVSDGTGNSVDKNQDTGSSDHEDKSSATDREKQGEKDEENSNIEGKEDGDTSDTGEYTTDPLIYRTVNYEILVSFDKEARIPQGTILHVDTIPRESLDYINYTEALKKQNPDLDQEVIFGIKHIFCSNTLSVRSRKITFQPVSRIDIIHRIPRIPLLRIGQDRIVIQVYRQFIAFIP